MNINVFYGCKNIKITLYINYNIKNILYGWNLMHNYRTQHYTSAAVKSATVFHLLKQTVCPYTVFYRFIMFLQFMHFSVDLRLRMHNTFACFKQASVKWLWTVFIAAVYIRWRRVGIFSFFQHGVFIYSVHI